MKKINATTLSYYYGCKYFDDGVYTCYNYGGTGNGKCYNKDGKMCMTADFNGEPKQGSCDETICDTHEGDYFLFGDVNTNLGACKFEDGLECYPVNGGTSWTCYQNGYRCGWECADPLNCKDCSDGYCLGEMEYDGTYCQGDGYYCTVNANGFYQECYFEENGTRCAQISAIDGKTILGNCIVGCPTGTTLAPIIPTSIQYYGCKNDTDPNMICYYSRDSGVVCRYGQNGEVCGMFCGDNYDGRDCKTVYRSECAKEGYCPQTGYDMSEGCTCEGSVSSSNGKQYCCPTGHSYLNGGCTLTKCPASEPYYSNGACVESCPKYISSDEKTCVDTCPDGQTADEDNICQTNA